MFYKSYAVEPTTTEELGCCDSDSAPMFGMCIGQVRVLELVPHCAGRGRHLRATHNDDRPGLLLLKSGGG